MPTFGPGDHPLPPGPSFFKDNLWRGLFLSVLLHLALWALLFLLLSVATPLLPSDDLPPLEAELIVLEEKPSPPPPVPPAPLPPQAKPLPKAAVKPPTAPPFQPVLSLAPEAGPPPPEKTAASEPAFVVAALPPAPAQTSPSEEALRQTYVQALWRHLLLFKPNKLREEGKALVIIVLSPSGGLISSEISTSSGNDQLDAAALRMTRQAQPYPARPLALGSAPLAFAVPIQFQPPSP
jgi:protein TonB